LVSCGFFIDPKTPLTDQMARGWSGKNGLPRIKHVSLNKSAHIRFFRLIRVPF